MDVCIVNCKDHSYRKIFEFVEKIEEAELLAQYAMKNKKMNELVFIFPGCNREYKEGEEKSAILLAKKYRSIKSNIYYADNLDLIKEKLHKMIENL